MGESFGQISRVSHQWYRLVKFSSVKMHLYLTATIFFVVCHGNIEDATSSESDLNGESSGVANPMTETSVEVGEKNNDTKSDLNGESLGVANPHLNGESSGVANPLTETSVEVGEKNNDTKSDFNGESSGVANPLTETSVEVGEKNNDTKSDFNGESSGVANPLTETSVEVGEKNNDTKSDFNGESSGAANSLTETPVEVGEKNNDTKSDFNGESSGAANPLTETPVEVGEKNNDTKSDFNGESSGAANPLTETPVEVGEKNNDTKSDFNGESSGAANPLTETPVEVGEKNNDTKSDFNGESSGAANPLTETPVEVGKKNNDTNSCSHSMSTLKCPDVSSFNEYLTKNKTGYFEVEIEHVGGIVDLRRTYGQFILESLKISEANLIALIISSENKGDNFFNGLKKLDISGNPKFEIHTLVDGGKLQDSLTHLSMRGTAVNQLDDQLPKLLRNYPNLEYLDVSYTGITYLHDPLIFTSNLKLTHLDASSNDKLGFVKLHYDTVQRLEHLNLSNCSLRTIEVQGHYSEYYKKDPGNMKDLDVSNNKLKEIPPLLLSALRNGSFFLNISSNDFEKASENCQTFHLWNFLQSLKKIGVEGSHVHVIGKEEVSFMELNALSNCPETSCPPGCRCNSKKKTVDCRNLGLTLIPYVAPSWAEVLLLQNNNLTTLEGIQSPVWCKLRILNVGYNSLSQIFSVDTMKPKCHCLSETYGKDVRSCFPQNMEKISLNDNVLQNYTKNGCLLLSPVRDLDLSRNRIEKFAPVCYQSMEHLEKLNLAGNEIADINIQQVAQYPVLQILYVSKCPPPFQPGLKIYILDHNLMNNKCITSHRQNIQSNCDGQTPDASLKTCPTSQSETTTDLNGTTNSSSETTTDLNGTINNSSETTTDLNGTTNSSSETTTDLNGTINNSSETTTDLNGTINNSSETTTDLNGTTNSSSETTTDLNGTTNSSSETTTDLNGTPNSSSETASDVNGTTSSLEITWTTIAIFFIICFILALIKLFWRNVFRCIRPKILNPRNIGNRKKYDCFVVCSSEDFTRVRDMIIVPLTQRGYSIAWHDNAFVPGDWIMHNVERAVQNSSRMMIFGTQNLVNSRWGLHEIRRGCHEEFVNPDFKVLALVDVTLPKTLNRDLYNIVCLRTHIKLTDRDYIEQICRFLPPQELPENCDLQPDNWQESLNGINELLERYEEIRRKERQISALRQGELFHTYREKGTVSIRVDIGTAFSSHVCDDKATCPSCQKEQYALIQRFKGGPHSSSALDLSKTSTRREYTIDGESCEDITDILNEDGFIRGWKRTTC
ncbi:LOW QUALITY PROTEIN: probable serine/threonine-protein kinase DDB_G0278509 [Palaemon carinicauda]|uniref:LOW QUALITY PROTEIN: probable serine/threonine-protein kinase DDB_G0278509 n=1 Tax=Palaemon carinicauda TaxID=392227 RepID=UPI0035B5FAF8